MVNSKTMEWVFLGAGEKSLYRGGKAQGLTTDPKIGVQCVVSVVCRWYHVMGGAPGKRSSTRSRSPNAFPPYIGILINTKKVLEYIIPYFWNVERLLEWLI